MRLMTAARSHATLTAIALAAVLAATLSAAAPDKVQKPSISLKATPQVGFSPVRMVFVAEIKGDDQADLYCPTVEWDWGDDTQSETRSDCEPFEAGKSEIKRRYVVDHTFDTAGDWKVQFRLKQKNKVIAQGSTTVKVRPGVRDGGQNYLQTGECPAGSPVRRPPCAP